MCRNTYHHYIKKISWNHEIKETYSNDDATKAKLFNGPNLRKKSYEYKLVVFPSLWRWCNGTQCALATSTVLFHFSMTSQQSYARLFIHKAGEGYQKREKASCRENIQQRKIIRKYKKQRLCDVVYSSWNSVKRHALHRHVHMSTTSSGQASLFLA